MPSSIFGGTQPAPQFAGNAVVDVLRQVRSMGAPRAAFQALVSSNPAFADFVRSCEGKSAAQVAAEHGIDYDAIRRLL